MSKQKYVFFDVDGVLLYDYHANPKYRIEWDKDIDKFFDFDILSFKNSFFGNNGAIYEVAVGKKDLKSALNEHLVKSGYKGKVDTFINHWFTHASHINYDILSAVTALSHNPDYNLFIATNQEKYRAKWLWEELNFKDIFQDIYYSGKLGVMKPDERFFKEIMKELNINSKEHLIYLIDDNEVMVNSAESLGWHTIWAWTPNDILESKLFKDGIKKKDFIL